MGRNYRECVVAVVKNDLGLYLVGQRAGKPGSWQFPQGGVDEGESPREALLRELEEEVGCGNVDILKECSEWISYDFPSSLNSAIAQRFKGQTQRWFLVSFKEGYGPDLSMADGEFDGIDWRSISEIVAGVVEWKKQAYMDGIAALELE